MRGALFQAYSSGRHLCAEQEMRYRTVNKETANTRGCGGGLRAKLVCATEVARGLSSHRARGFKTAKTHRKGYIRIGVEPIPAACTAISQPAFATIDGRDSETVTMRRDGFQSDGYTYDSSRLFCYSDERF